ncbi:MAG: hypothetical protein ABIB41_11290 [Nitrospirota bacterium]
MRFLKKSARTGANGKKNVCVDTDVCIDFLRRKEPGLTLLIKLLEKFDPCITTITAFELHLGHITNKTISKVTYLLLFCHAGLSSIFLQEGFQTSWNDRQCGLTYELLSVVYLTHLYNNPPAVIPVKTGIQKQKNWIPDQVRNDNK